MANDINIRIRALLDQASSTTGINSQIKQIESKLSSVKMKFDKTSIQQVYDSVSKSSRIIATFTDQWKQQYTIISAINKETGELVTLHEKLKTNNNEEIAQQKQLNSLRKQGQEYTKQAAAQLSKLSSKYSYGDLSGIQSLQKELSSGGNFQSLQTIPSKIAEYQQRIAQLTSEVQLSHSTNLQAINKEIAADNLAAKQRIANEKLLQAEKAKTVAQSMASTNNNYFGKSAQASASVFQNLFNQSSLASKTLGDVEGKIYRLNPQISTMSDSTKKAASSMRTLRDETDHTKQSIVDVAKKFAEWILIGNLVMKPINAFRDGIDYIMELDNAMNEVQIVTGKTKDQVDTLASSYNKLAQQMSVTTSELAGTAADLYRQGLGDDDVEERMKGIVEYAKISSISLKESNQIITATANATGRSVENITDIFAYLGDTTASGADEIGEALQRVASASDNSNLSLEKTSSWLATISSVSRESAAVIGRSLNSIISRYESIKEKGFNEEDATQINDVTKALSSIGISPTVDGQLRDLNEVMDEVGAKWGTLTKNEKAYIATTMAGTYQRNRFITLMNNYDDSLKNYDNAMNSAGQTAQKFAIYQESAQAHVDSFAAALEQLWQNSFNSDNFKQLIDLGTGLVHVFDAIVNSGLGRIALLFMAGAVAGKVFAGILVKMSSSAIVSMVSVMKMGTALIGFKNTLAIATVAMMESPLFIGAVAVVGIYAIVKAVDALTVSLDEQADKVASTASAINSLQSEYDELKNKSLLTEDEKKRLDILDKELQIKKELLEVEKETQANMIEDSYTGTSNAGSMANKYGPTESTKLDESNKKLEKYKELVDDVAKAEDELKNARGTADEDDKILKLEKLNNQMATSKDALMEEYKALQPLIESGKILSPQMQEYVTNLEKQLGLYGDYNTIVKDADNIQNMLVGTMTKMNNGQALTRAEVEKLVKIYPDLSSAVSGASDEWYVEIDALNNVATSSKNSVQTQIEAQIKLTENVIEQAKQRMKAYTLEGAALSETAQQNIANIKAGMPGAMGDYIKSKTGKDPGITDNTLLNDAESRLANLKALSAELDKIGSGSNATTPDTISSSGGSAKSSSTPSAIDYTDTTNSLIKSYNTQVEIDKVQSDSLERQIKIAKAAKDYNKEIELSNALLANQEKTVSDLLSANQNISAEADRLRATTKYDTTKWFDANGEDTLAYINLLNTFAGKTDEASKKEYESLKKVHDGIQAAKQAWTDNLSEIYSVQDAIESTKQSIADLNKELLETEKTKYDSALEAINKKLEDAIDLLNDEKDAIEKNATAQKDALQSQIDALEDKKDALEAANDATETAIELETLQTNLANAKSEKNIRQYSAERGWEWVASDSAIKDAQTALDEFQHNQKISAIEAEIDELEKKGDAIDTATDEEIANIEEQISAYEEYKTAWADSVSSYEDKQNELNAQQTLGADYEKKVLDGRLSTLQSFTESYEALMSRIAAANATSTGSSSTSTSTSSSKSSSSSSSNNATATIPGVGTVGVSINSSGKVTTTGLSSGTVVHTSGGDYTITGGSGGNYTSTNKYANGGVADFTGLAQLDGTSSSSEIIFNASDSKKLYDLIHNTSNLSNYIADSMLNYVIPKISTAATSSTSNVSSSNDVVIQNMNVYPENSNDFIKQIRNISAITGKQ